MKLSSLIAIPSQFASRFCGTALIALCRTALASSVVFAAGGNTTPVTVVGDVEETNDVSRMPYSRNHALVTGGPSDARAVFDIPDGKRFVIEAVSYSLAIKHNVYFSVSLEPLTLLWQDRLLASREGRQGRKGFRIFLGDLCVLGVRLVWQEYLPK